MSTTTGTDRLGHHAVVIGASIAGLAAAQVLADRFDRVTLLDRDTLPTEPRDRVAVPQGRHGHALLASGLIALEQLFPGIESGLLGAGAIGGDVIGDVRWFQHGRYKKKFHSGLRGVLMSRPLLEHTIRACVRRRHRIRIVDGCHAIGLLAAPGYERVIGVRTAQGRDEALELADLVIDASGRASRSPT
jgi:2-polyprenyl-6-methoxyphenol hydroxylase-like FAD-dependent oxidoreductase